MVNLDNCLIIYYGDKSKNYIHILSDDGTTQDYEISEVYDNLITMDNVTYLDYCCNMYDFDTKMKKYDKISVYSLLSYHSKKVYLQKYYYKHYYAVNEAVSSYILDDHSFKYNNNSDSLVDWESFMQITASCKDSSMYSTILYEDGDKTVKIFGPDPSTYYDITNIVIHYAKIEYKKISMEVWKIIIYEHASDIDVELIGYINGKKVDSKKSSNNTYLTYNYSYNMSVAFIVGDDFDKYFGSTLDIDLEIIIKYKNVKLESKTISTSLTPVQPAKDTLKLTTYDGTNVTTDWYIIPNHKYRTKVYYTFTNDPKIKNIVNILDSNNNIIKSSIEMTSIYSSKFFRLDNDIKIGEEYKLQLTQKTNLIVDKSNITNSFKIIDAFMGYNLYGVNFKAIIKDKNSNDIDYIYYTNPGLSEFSAGAIKKTLSNGNVKLHASFKINKPEKIYMDNKFITTVNSYISPHNMYLISMKKDETFYTTFHTEITKTKYTKNLFRDKNNVYKYQSMSASIGEYLIKLANDKHLFDSNIEIEGAVGVKKVITTTNDLLDTTKIHEIENEIFTNGEYKTFLIFETKLDDIKSYTTYELTFIETRSDYITQFDITEG